MSTTLPTDDSPALSPRRAQALAVLGRVLGAEPVTEAFRDNLRAFVPADKLLESLRALKEEAGFAMLAELGGVDYLGYPGRDPGRHRFEVHYVLLDLDSGARIVVKVGVSDPDPTLPSVMPLWLGADWMEREVFDMYGIRFEGHPDLRRILMPEEFVAFPLRKDYPLRGRGERHNFPRITRDQS
jgi:NADH-quinone oxidoreductase subunit C